MNGLIVVVGLFVGYAVYRFPLTTPGGSASLNKQGDLSGGIAAAAAAIVILAFLFGRGDGTANQDGGNSPTPVATVHETRIDSPPPSSVAK